MTHASPPQAPPQTEDVIWEQLRKLILSQNPGMKELRPDQQLFGELGYDSLRMMILIVAIEKTFGIELRGDDLAQARLETPGALVTLIAARQRKQKGL